MCRTHIPKDSWPLMLAPGHNPYTTGPSPAILMISSEDGTLLPIIEQRNLILAYREDVHRAPADRRFTDDYLADRWNYTDLNFPERIALYNPDGLRRFNTLGPTAHGNLLRSLGFEPNAPFPPS